MQLSRSVMIFIALATVAQPAFAYLDPGAGSMVLQMLIAGIMGVLFTVKTYWQWLKNFIAGLFGKRSGTPLGEAKLEDKEDKKPTKKIKQ